ncbi:MAG: DUF3793 family protein [Agathobacter sp.]|nr:DUF3793 family protein [Agathobacter sp.]MBQ3559523.1 DUF3793 family protein [Agathobacter sp.]
MCQEVFKIVQTMDLSQVETKLVLQCAPLIKGIKMSNLLIVSSKDEDAVRIILKKTGILHYRLLRQDEKTTFLLFRKMQLATHLNDPEVQRILKANGYHDLSLGGILRTFQYRYQTYMDQGEGFPHEMGLLLGYPLEDVLGFIEHKGNNYLYSGYWKVYADVASKRKIFDAYEEAKEELIVLLANGHGIRPIIQLYREQSIPFAS